MTKKELQKQIDELRENIVKLEEFFNIKREDFVDKEECLENWYYPFITTSTKKFINWRYVKKNNK